MAKNPAGVTGLYKTRQSTKHYVNADSTMQCSPIYRGFSISCLGVEIEAIKRDIDRFWSDAYVYAASPAARELALMQEQQQRRVPKEWPTQ